MDNKERKEIKGFIATIKTENDAIGKRLASMVSLIGTTRASQLGIDLIITELEERLNE